MKDLLARFHPETFHCLDSSIGIWEVNLETGISTWSDNMYNLFGVKDKIPPRTIENFYDLLYPEDKILVKKAFEKFLNESKTNPNAKFQPIYRVNVLSNLRYIRSFGIKYKSDNNTEHVGGCCTDITNLILENSLDHERKSKANLQRLIRTVSHEIRNPLQGILSNTKYLLNLIEENTFDTKNLSELKELVEDTLQCAIHQSMVINDLLDYELVLNTKNLLFEEIELDILIDSVISMFRHNAHTKNLELLYQHSKLKFITNYSHLKKVIINLVSNSIKFTEKGNITIKASFDQNNQEYIIEVIDTGTGIEDDIKDLIFIQAGVTTTNKIYADGSGLGLVICNTLIKEINGNIKFKSNKEGTTMIITLPIIPNKNEDKDEDEVKSQKDKNIETINIEHRNTVLTHLKILLAEDNMINQKIYQRQLKTNVSLTYSVYNGQEALNKFFENINFFDIIICDVHMPFYNGFEVADKIRQVSKIPILFLSGEITINYEDLFNKYSPCLYLLKPVNSEQLLNSIYKLFYIAL